MNSHSGNLYLTTLNHKCKSPVKIRVCDEWNNADNPVKTSVWVCITIYTLINHHEQKIYIIYIIFSENIWRKWWKRKALPFKIVSHFNNQSLTIKENNVLEHLDLHSWMNQLIVVHVSVSSHLFWVNKENSALCSSEGFRDLSWKVAKLHSHNRYYILERSFIPAGIRIWVATVLI